VTISKYIQYLQALQHTEGDLEVFQGGNNTVLGSIAPATPPTIKEVAFLSGRERTARYLQAHELEDKSKLTGRYIVYIGR
jgi:hypothetical protein